MTTFRVEGPFEVPTDVENGHTMIANKRLNNKFWHGDRQELMRRRGCYVFMIKAGPRYTPWYVGKATVNFGQ